MGDITPDGRITLIDALKPYGSIDPDIDSDGWRSLAATLAGYVDAGSAIAVEETGSKGGLSFEGLDVGLYLLCSKACVSGDKSYVSEPALISLPGKDADGNWIYSVKIYPKPGEPRTVLRVQKIWKDSKSKDRPAEVKVQLLADGEAVETVVLSKENNWRYIWDDLDPAVVWQAVEKPVPDDYTPSVKKEGSLTTITNTLTADVDPDEDDDETLPQTGVLWWPVWVLATAGMALFLLGWCRQRREEE